MWRCRDRRFASALPSAEARAYHCALPAQNGRLSVATSAMRAGMEASRLTCFAGPEYDPIISFGLPFEPGDCPYGKSRFTYYCLWALQPTLVEYEHSGTVFGAINKR